MFRTTVASSSHSQRTVMYIDNQIRIPIHLTAVDTHALNTRCVHREIVNPIMGRRWSRAAASAL